MDSQNEIEFKNHEANIIGPKDEGLLSWEYTRIVPLLLWTRWPPINFQWNEIYGHMTVENGSFYLAVIWQRMEVRLLAKAVTKLTKKWRGFWKFELQ